MECHTHPDLGVFWSAADRRSGSHRAGNKPLCIFVCDPVRGEMLCSMGRSFEDAQVLVYERAAQSAESSDLPLSPAGELTRLAGACLRTRGYEGSLRMHATLRGRTCLKLRLVMPKGRRRGSHEHRAGAVREQLLPGLPPAAEQELYDAMLTRFEGGDYSGKLRLRTRGERGRLPGVQRSARMTTRSCSGSAAVRVHTGQTGDMRCAVLYTPDQIGRIRYQLRRCLFQLVRGTAGLPPVEREILVYERIARRLTYINNGDVRDHNIVGPVLLSAGVCEGYNALLMLALRRVGLPCIKVYGVGKSGGGHCWSVVWLEGEPVHCDVTWDKPSRGAVRFAYLNRSDCQIARDHGDFRRPGIPVCRSERWNYDTLALSG